MISAMIMMFTLSVVFPALQQWMIKTDDGITLKETQKLRNAINEIHSMGDVGSIEKVQMNLPPGYSIKVRGDHLEAYRQAMYNAQLSSETLASVPLDSRINANVNSGGHAQADQIFGLMTIELVYGVGSTSPSDFQIQVK